MLASHEPGQQRWCSDASSLASELKVGHLALRERIKALRLLPPLPAIYARPIRVKAG